MTKIVIMDIDGTLANAEHRVHLLPSARPDDPRPSDELWQEFFDQAPFDTPNWEIVALNNAMRAAGYDIIVVTGRSERERQMTKNWFNLWNIQWDELHMRSADDKRHDTEVKAEILAELRARGMEVVFAVEDRATVTAMWRANGVRCLQVCEGDY